MRATRFVVGQQVRVPIGWTYNARTDGMLMVTEGDRDAAVVSIGGALVTMQHASGKKSQCSAWNDKPEILAPTPPVVQGTGRVPQDKWPREYARRPDTGHRGGPLAPSLETGVGIQSPCCRLGEGCTTCKPRKVEPWVCPVDDWTLLPDA